MADIGRTTPYAGSDCRHTDGVFITLHVAEYGRRTRARREGSLARDSLAPRLAAVSTHAQVTDAQNGLQNSLQMACRAAPQNGQQNGRRPKWTGPLLERQQARRSRQTRPSPCRARLGAPLAKVVLVMLQAKCRQLSRRRSIEILGIVSERCHGVFATRVEYVDLPCANFKSASSQRTPHTRALPQPFAARRGTCQHANCHNPPLKAFTLKIPV
jgi:hypothetical protein